MNNTKKTYPTEVSDELMLISKALMECFNASKSNLRTVSKFSGLSVNSVKSVLTGKTANIASYSLIAKALGTNLIDIVGKIHQNRVTAAATSSETVSIVSQ